MGDEEYQLYSFFAKFENRVYSLGDPDKRRVFFSRKPEIQSNLSSSSLSSANVQPDPWLVHDLIKSAFLEFIRCLPKDLLKGLLVQFWGGKRITNGWRLTTLYGPFILDYVDPRHQEYRLWCVDETNASDFQTLPIYHPIMDFFPDVTVDLEIGIDCPLVDKARECGFRSHIMLPVYYPSPITNTTICVGVIECCLESSFSLLGVFNELRSAAQGVGLHTHHADPRPEPNPGLEAAKHEIKRALQMVCEWNHLALAQVWIPYDVEHVPPPLTSFPRELKEKNPILKHADYMVKLCGYQFNDFDVGFSSIVKDYCDLCDVLPYQVGMWFVGTTLMTYGSRFCKNMGVLTLDESFGFLRLVADRTQCSCLVVCLRSTHTGKDVDYAFEFLWPKTRYHSIVLKSLLSTLKSCLPSFKFASGEQFDDVLFIEDVEHSTRSPDVIWSSEQPKALVKAALDSGAGGKGVKRKLDELIETVDVVQSVACADRYGEEVDDIIIVATYNEFTIQTSYTLANVEEKIEKEFKLHPGSYTMKYEIEGKTGTLTSDQDLTSCIGLWRSGQRSRILLHVEKNDQPSFGSMTLNRESTEGKIYIQIASVMTCPLLNYGINFVLWAKMASF